MPAYGTDSSHASIAQGESFQVWNAEQPAPGSGGVAASVAVALSIGQGHPNGVNFRGFFSGAPGVFEIDVQASDVDADTQFQTLPNGNITTVDSVNNTFLFEDPNCSAKFVRALMRSRTNAVNVTGNFKR